MTDNYFTVATRQRVFTYAFDSGDKASIAKAWGQARGVAAVSGALVASWKPVGIEGPWSRAYVVGKQRDVADEVVMDDKVVNK